MTRLCAARRSVPSAMPSRRARASWTASDSGTRLEEPCEYHRVPPAYAWSTQGEPARRARICCAGTGPHPAHIFAGTGLTTPTCLTVLGFGAGRRRRRSCFHHRRPRPLRRRTRVREYPLSTSRVPFALRTFRVLLEWTTLNLRPKLSAKLPETAGNLSTPPDNAGNFRQRPGPSGPPLAQGCARRPTRSSRC